MRADFKQQLEKCEHERLKNINDLEKELAKQRERTVKILAEKDAEIERVKSQAGMHIINNSDELASKSSPKKSSDGKTEDAALNSSFDSDTLDINDKLTISSNIFANVNSNQIANLPESNRLIYYSQQSAYKDMELNKLRMAKNELEYKLKQTNDEHSVDLERLQNQIGILKQEIERLKLNSSRNELNGANFEYIKNVVFNFMTTKVNTSVTFSFLKQRVSNKNVVETCK